MGLGAMQVFPYLQLKISREEAFSEMPPLAGIRVGTHIAHGNRSPDAMSIGCRGGVANRLAISKDDFSPQSMGSGSSN